MTVLKQNKSYFAILLIVSLYLINQLSLGGWSVSPFFWAAFIGWLGLLAMLLPLIKRGLHGETGKLERILAGLGAVLAISSMLILAFLTLKAVIGWYAKSAIQ